MQSSNYSQVSANTTKERKVKRDIKKVKICNSTQHGIFREANSSSGSEDNFCILFSHNPQHFVQTAYNQPLFPVKKPSPQPEIQFFKIYFNIIPSSTARSSKFFSFLWAFYQNRQCSPPPLSKCHRHHTHHFTLTITLIEWYKSLTFQLRCFSINL
jgi:hypothetical protein